MLEYIILGLLMEQPMSGYDMKKTIDHSVGIFYRASFGSLYPALKRLETKRWVSVSAELDHSKNKKLYTLLPEGKATFLAWLAEPIQLSRSELLLKVFFFDYLDEDTRQQRLSEYQMRLGQEIGRLKAVEGIVAGELKEVPNPENYYYRVSVLSYGLDYFLMEQKWIQAIKERKNLNDDRNPNEN
ncbi:DNA-binding transcriptional regulator, PadR family [Paenibacillus algorifonticola]|uniref:DNA-binding transcriptional regulator, PadR family n=1 Tax=Paenibacillus algorifonticola TaxID=684063 RepID=A0A1I2IJY0_9BACL|nr:helix-turn-helix transcriptional regulator [Paenibacillus algorifonticola]SFF41953.1 DNA-binding transcriptional regulator, PadR family [Paenibacillus algorifonticola]